MPLETLAIADPEIAALTFKRDLGKLWGFGRPDRLGWVRTDVDPLHTFVRIPATRPTGEVDHYYFRFGAEYYDAAPPVVELVMPDGVTHPAVSSGWFPKLEPIPWFQIHHTYGWPDGTQRQLVCYSMAAGFYQTNHSPQEHERWLKGRHTVAASLSRIAEALSSKYYRGRHP